MRKPRLFAAGMLTLLIALLVGSSTSIATVSAEEQVSAADVTATIPGNAVSAVATNTITITPGADGIHIYTIQASIADNDSIAEQGHMTLLHTELRATLYAGATVIGTIQVPLEYEIVGATLYTTFRYRLTSVGAGPGSDIAPVGPFDLINTVVTGHTVTSVLLSATFGVKNNDPDAPHSVIMGINAIQAPF